MHEALRIGPAGHRSHAVIWSRSMRLRAILCAMLVSSVALADPPTKEQVKDAEPHFFKGVDFFNEQDFPNAVLEFKKAYEIAPDFHVLFNVGQACYQAQN